MIQIESLAGIEQLDEILDVPGIGVIFLGPTDPATSTGEEGLPVNKILRSVAILLLSLSLWPSMTKVYGSDQTQNGNPGDVVISVSEPVAESAVVEEQSEESALQGRIRRQQQMELFNQQIAELESEFGPYDYRLQEPLRGITSLLVEAGDFEEVGSNLNRRLQLMHTSEGLYSLNQLPIIAEHITNDLRQQQWRSVTERFEYIHLIQTQNDVDSSTLINSLNDVRAWHLAAIYTDEPRRRIEHFLDSTEIQSNIISLAEKEFGEESEMLIPWLYEKAVEQHRVFAFLNSMDELGYDAARHISSREDRAAPSYLREGLQIVERIQDITETMNNPEAHAMAMLYVGDFQMLRREQTTSRFGGRVASRRRGIAGRTYRRAMDMLREAGISEERIEAFFARPVVLPVAQFHLSLDAAIAQQEYSGYRVEASTENETGPDDAIHLGDFIALNESLPFARRPEPPELALPIATEPNAVVELRFRIDSVGKSRSPRIEQSTPDLARVQRDAKDAIESMQFRPRFERGRWRAIRNVTMRYLYPPPM